MFFNKAFFVKKKKQRILLHLQAMNLLKYPSRLGDLAMKTDIVIPIAQRSSVNDLFAGKTPDLASQASETQSRQQ